MKPFLTNLVLAVLWGFLWGEMSLWTLLVGFAGGYVVLFLFTRIHNPSALRDAYPARVLDGIKFSGYFIKQLIISNLQIAWEVITPGFGMTPRLIRYDVTGMTDTQVAAFSTAVTLTPGTLVVDMRDSPDGKRLIYVHCMYAQSRIEATKELDGMRNRMSRDLFRIPPREMARELMEAKNP